MKRLIVKDTSRCIGCYSCMLACARYNQASYAPGLSAVQVRTQGGLQGKLSLRVCRACLEPLCAEACKAEALLPRSGGGVTLQGENCTGCARCVDACLIGAIRLIAGHPLVCHQCGICASFCPHEVLVFAEQEEGQW